MILDTLAASTRKRVAAAKEEIPMGTMMNLASRACENDTQKSVSHWKKP